MHTGPDQHWQCCRSDTVATSESRGGAQVLGILERVDTISNRTDLNFCTQLSLSTPTPSTPSPPHCLLVSLSCPPSLIWAWGWMGGGGMGGGSQRQIRRRYKSYQKGNKHFPIRTRSRSAFSHCPLCAHVRLGDLAKKVLS